MQKICTQCGDPFEASRPNATYCGARCRKRAQRSGTTGGTARTVPLSPVSDSPAEDGPVTAATRAELAHAGRDQTAIGQAALAAARRIDTPTSDSGSAVASLIREHRAALAEALDGARPAEDELEKIRKRRARKLG